MKYFRNPADNNVYAYDPIEQQALIDEAEANGWIDVTNSWPPAPTDADLKQICQGQAKYRLEETDYSQLPDVAARLTNKAEFDSYRTQVRALYLNPVTNPSWPTAPKAVWNS